MKHYKKAIEFCPTWETGYFRLAVYYDKYLASRPCNQPLYWRVYKQTAQNYGRFYFYLALGGGFLMFLVLVSLNYYCDDYILLKGISCDMQITKAVKK